MTNLKTILQKFENTPNKIYFFLIHKKAILWFLAGLAFVFGVIGFVESPKINGFDVFNRSIGLFAFAWIDETNGYLVLAEFLATLTVFLGAITLFLSDMVNGWVVRSVQKNPFTLLVGLGMQNSNFLKSQDNNTSSTIIIESDSQNPNIEQCKQKGFGVVVERAEEAISKLDLKNLKTAIISTGNDRQNIAIAIVLIKKLKNESSQKIFLRVENRDLGVLFKQNVIKMQKSVDVIVYSLFENITKELFEKHSILGYQREIINSKDTYNIVLIGDSPLAIEIIYQLSILSNLPNQNRLNLYLINPKAKKFYKKIQKLFTQIEKIPHLNIKPIKLDSETLEFYTNKVWKSPNLTNIIIATQSQEQNLDIAINLQDTTFIKQIAENRFKTKVLFAIYRDLGLSKEIDSDKKAFANFHTFADIAKASSSKNIIDEELNLIAKSIHYQYKEIEYNPNLLFTEDTKNDIEKRWLSVEMFSDKISNKMQSIHINTKLLALNLKKQKSNKTPKELLKINQNIFNEKLGIREINNQKLQEYSKKVAKFQKDTKQDLTNLPEELNPTYIPKNFESLFEKLIRSEHNRWNTYHYLNGWKYNKKKNKSAKEHNCLLPFEGLTNTIIFDIYALLYIPNISTKYVYQIGLFFYRNHSNIITLIECVTFRN
jgi:Trk K+ transport system NAD-binding subunit